MSAALRCIHLSFLVRWRLAVRRRAPFDRRRSARLGMVALGWLLVGFWSASDDSDCFLDCDKNQRRWKIFGEGLATIDLWGRGKKDDARLMRYEVMWSKPTINLNTKKN